MEMAQNAGVRGKEAYGVDYRSWAKSGLVAGLIGGITFALFEMIVALILMGQFFFSFTNDRRHSSGTRGPFPGFFTAGSGICRCSRPYGVFYYSGRHIRLDYCCG
ncbi:hypothetical protein QA601_10170 [Chitinispirillales bacterium ANBcel5]|uniref:hypothetical protein n=1 Tax=Cellulosispirillum alkaliphilum TaxID=3039283 RepID=UPI002A5320B3|nr:hypothetical protein [Chitinispirillales bacterium ANBcel5]